MKKIVKTGPGTTEIAEVSDHSTAAPAYWADACKHLIKKDRVMKRLIPKFGDTSLQARGDAFSTLARSIVGQQISVKAAQAVWNRFEALAKKPRGAGPPQGPRAPSGGSEVRAATNVGVTSR